MLLFILFVSCFIMNIIVSPSREKSYNLYKTIVFNFQEIYLYYSNSFLEIKPSLHSWGKFHLAMMYNFLYVAVFSFSVFC